MATNIKPLMGLGKNKAFTDLFQQMTGLLIISEINDEVGDKYPDLPKQVTVPKKMLIKALEDCAENAKAVAAIIEGVLPEVIRLNPITGSDTVITTSTKVEL